MKRFMWWLGMGIVVTASLVGCGLGSFPPPPRQSTAIATQMPASVITLTTETSDVYTTTSTSPNGLWVAQSTAWLPKSGSSQNVYATRLVVRRTNGQQHWLAVESQGPFGLGYSTPQPLTWAKNGDALYFTHEFVGDGCALFANGSDLHRLDLATGQVITIAPSVGSWLALSPDENFLAGLGGRQLAVYDLTKQFSQIIKLTDDDTTQFGHTVWSPDGKKIALTAARHPCSGDDRYDTLLVDVATMTVTTLIANDDNLFVPTGWEDTEHVILKNKEHTWLLNVRTRSLKREN